MSAAKFKLLFTVAIALIIAIVCMRLFSCNSEPRKQVAIDNTAQLQKDLAQQTANYNAKIDSINEVNLGLRSQAVNTQSAILKIKQENRSLKRTINDLLTIHYTATDTAIKLQNCDSLAVVLQETEALSNRKDSAFESLTGNLKQQLEIQDSVIDIKKFQNDSLQTSYERLLDQHSALVAENTEQRKVIKKQKRNNQVKKGILLPEYWDPGQQVADNVTVPIIKALPLIKSLVQGSNIDTNNGLSFIKRGSLYKIVVAGSRARGGNIYLDKDLLQLVDGNNFQKTSDKMVAVVDEKDITAFVQVLQANHGLSMTINTSQLRQIEKQEIPSTTRIPIELPPPPPVEPKEEAPVVNMEQRRRREMEARALKLKLQLLAA